MQARTKNTVHEHCQVFVFLFKNQTREIIVSRALLAAFFCEEFRKLQGEAQKFRDKLALPCNDTQREAIMATYKLIQADLAEMSAIIRDLVRDNAVRDKAVREMEERERAALREVLRENQQHETLLNLSKEINQILDAKRVVFEKLIATSSEAERQRLESLHAELQIRENAAIAHHEAYLKQGMATSLRVKLQSLTSRLMDQ